MGDDQRQHLELARDVAIRFNHRFGDTLVVPKAAIPPVGARIMDLQDPTGEDVEVGRLPAGHASRCSTTRSASRSGSRRAVTDSDDEVRFDPATKPGVSNLLQILARYRRTGAIATVEAEFAGGGYGALKAAVADAVVEFVRPLQERYARARARPRRGRPDPGRGRGAPRRSPHPSSPACATPSGCCPADSSRVDCPRELLAAVARRRP